VGGRTHVRPDVPAAWDRCDDRPGGQRPSSRVASRFTQRPTGAQGVRSVLALQVSVPLPLRVMVSCDCHAVKAAGLSPNRGNVAPETAVGILAVEIVRNPTLAAEGHGTPRAVRDDHLNTMIREGDVLDTATSQESPRMTEAGPARRAGAQNSPTASAEAIVIPFMFLPSVGAWVGRVPISRTPCEERGRYRFEPRTSAAIRQVVDGVVKRREGAIHEQTKHGGWGSRAHHSLPANPGVHLGF
jgi:hypothetical protein